MKMKKIILSLLAALVCSMAYAQSGGMQFKGFSESKGALTGDNMLARFVQNWPVDVNDEECALVRVKVENFPLEEARKLDFTVTGSGTASVGRLDDSHLTQNSTLWVFMSHGTGLQLKATHKTTGVSYGTAVFSIPTQLEAKHVYDVTLALDKTTTINIGSVPAGAQVFLDGASIGVTPLTRQAVPFGDHKLKLVLGTQSKEMVVSVTDQNNVFNDFDLRQRRSVRFESDPSGSEVVVTENQKQIATGRTPCELELPYGNFEVTANKNGMKDSKSLTVNAATGTVALYPEVKREIQLVGTLNGKHASTRVTVQSHKGNWQQDELKSREVSEVHTETLPYGKYTVTARAAGSDDAVGKKTITVNGSSPSDYIIRMKATNKAEWFWNKTYDPAPFGIVLGYVQKQYVFRGNGERIRYNGVWAQYGEDKWLHGFEVGFRYQPALRWGLGLQTGIMMDWYVSSSKEFGTKYNTDHTNYQEIDIYVPAHVMYRVRLGEKQALMVHGGVGLYYAVYGAYRSTDKSNDEQSVKFGESCYPNAFQATAEIGVGLRLGPIQINGIYSKGFTDNDKLKDVLQYKDGYKATMNRYAIQLSYVIGSD